MADYYDRGFSGGGGYQGGGYQGGGYQGGDPSYQSRKRPSDPHGPPPGEDGFKRRRMGEGPGPGPEGTDIPPATLRILVRNQDAGGIIGKGGENIKRLRKQYDCQVILPDSAGASERVMTMMGMIESCVGVLGDVLPKLGEGMGMHNPGPDAMMEVQVLIPQPFMGTIIGTGGAKIKELRARTKATVKIFSEPMPNSNERSIQLMGTTDQILECVHHFLDDISKKEPREPIFLYEPGSTHFMGGSDSQEPGGGGGGMGMRGGRGRGGQSGGFRGGRGRGGRGGFNGGGQWSPQRGGRGGRGGPRGGGGHGQFHQGGGHHGSGHMSYGSPAGPPSAPPSASQPPPAQQYPPPAQSQGVGSYPGQGAVGYGQPAVGYTASQPPNNSQGAVAGPSSNPMPAPGPTIPPMYMPPSQLMPQQTPTAAPQQPHHPQLFPQQPPPAPMPAPRQQPAAGQQTQTQQVTIPNEYVNSIIGPGGTQLQQIKGQSSCDISINDPKPGTMERVITIVGTPNGIQFAQQLMQNSVRQHHSV